MPPAWSRAAAVLLAALLVACAQPAPSLLSPAYDTASPSRLHHAPQGYRNVGRFRPSDGASAAILLTDPFRERVGAPPERLPRAAVLEGIEAARGSALAATWIGHSTYLLRIGRRWVLTDPQFSDYASPVPGFGPRRLVPPAIGIADLPPIDAVLISHNHYDHMDTPSLRALAVRFPHAVAVVPLKNDGPVSRAGFADVRVLDWFGATEIAGVTVTATPAVHSSRRAGMATNSALWSGFSIEGDGSRVYFAGDTGYGSFIDDVRDELGRHDLALVPIGAYRPQSVESERHTTPEDAVRLATALGARTALPIHWGTFALTAEPFAEQSRRFRAAGRGVRTPVPRVGETIVLRRGPSS